MKVCYICNIENNESYFFKDKSRKDGLRYACKDCNKEYKKKYQKTNKGRLSIYKTGAKVRNISFDLTEEQFFSFWQKDCYYCGDKIETIGIDRIDSSKGYEIENCVSCCIRCNRIFMQYNKNETFTHIQKMLNKYLLLK